MSFRKIRPEHILAFLFFASVFLFFYHPLKIGDFWWHLANGRWIWENRGLPAVDPFAYTTTPENAARTVLVLKGYWLAQVIYYAIFGYFGFHGLVVFNGALFTLTFFVLWKILKFKGIGSAVGLFILIPGLLLARQYDELRPQNFTFIGALILFYLMEKTIAELRRGTSSKTSFFLIPLLIVPWVNLHRGYIVIYAVLSAYALGEALTHLLRRRMPGFNLFLRLIALAAAATLINPNFINPIVLGIKESLYSASSGDIIEFVSPWSSSIRAWFKTNVYVWLLALQTVAMTAVMVKSWRRLELSHIFLYAGFAVAGAVAFRFNFFFILFSTAIAGGYAAHLQWPALKRLKPLAVLVTACFSAFVIVSSLKNADASAKQRHDATLPVSATEFLKKNRLPGPLFNPFGWGGYLQWELYPEYRVFIDPRTIDFSVHEKYKKARDESSRDVLDEYGVKTVIFSPVREGVEGIVIDLLKDKELWSLVYFDTTAVIFVRKDISTALQIDDALLFNYLFSYAFSKINNNPPDNSGFFDLADIYYALGEEKMAEAAYRKGIERNRKIGF